MDGQLQETQLSTTEQKLQKEPLPGIVAIFVEPHSVWYSLEISRFLNRRTRLNLLGQRHASFRFENGDCFGNYRDRPSLGNESLFLHRMNQTGYGNPAQHHFLDDACKLRASARPRLDNVICLEYLHKIPSGCCRLAIGGNLASNR
jgi:hypothetical protein